MKKFNLEKLTHTSEEFNEIVGMIMNSKASYETKIDKLAKYCKVVIKNNFGKILVSGAEDMEYFREFFVNIEDVIIRANILEKTDDCDFDITKLWVSYPDGKEEHKLVDLIWK